MKYIKPEITFRTMEQIIQETFGAKTDSLSEAPQGQIGRTYSVLVNGGEYFLTFNQPNMAYGNRTEQLYADKLRRASIHTRKFVALGQAEGYDYAITEKIKGISLEELTDEDFLAHTPEILKTLEKISRIDISDTTGYGWFNGTAEGSFRSWFSFLDFVYEEEEEDKFFGKWHALFESTYLNRKEYDRYFGKMQELYPCLPQERSLIHSNYGFGNVFLHQGRVSAVMDWQDASFGDYLLDFAKFIFWLPRDKQDILTGEYKKILKDQSRNISHFKERIDCYEYYIGLDSLRFFAYTDNEEAYRTLKSFSAKVTDSAQGIGKEKTFPCPIPLLPS